MTILYFLSLKWNGEIQPIGPDQKQFVTQIFTAALNMNDSPTSIEQETSNLIVEVAQLLLNAAYRGTLLAAFKSKMMMESKGLFPDGRNKLFLTLIGGGVFGNMPNWILKAFKFNEHLMRDTKLDVTLVVFNEAQLSHEMVKYFGDLVDQTGGKIIRT